MMPPPCNEMIPPGAPRLLADEFFPRRGFWSSRFELPAAGAAQAFAGELDAMGVVNEAVENGVGVGGVAEYRRAPPFLIG